MKKMVFEQRVINWVSEEDVPGREKKGTKQTGGKAREVHFDRCARFVSGRVDVRLRRQDEVPFRGLSYSLSVKLGLVMLQKGQKLESQVYDKWRVNESHKFLDKRLTFSVTREQGMVICLSLCELPPGVLGVRWTSGPRSFLTASL